MTLSLKQVKEHLRAVRFAFPGGYPMYFIAQDGEPLSFEAVRDNFRTVCYAHMNGESQWAIEAVEINWEDPDLYCSHTNERIESAYAENEIESA